MNKFIPQDNHGQTWARVSKSAACKAFSKGEEITFCPVKLHPFGAGCPGTTRGAGEYLFGKAGFDHYVTAFAWNNCNSEAGNYLAYYVKG